MTDPTNVHEPVPQSAKLTAREKKWIIYDVGNSVHGGLHARLVHHHRHLVGGIHHPAAYQLPPSALSRHP